MMSVCCVMTGVHLLMVDDDCCVMTGVDLLMVDDDCLLCDDRGAPVDGG